MKNRRSISIRRILILLALGLTVGMWVRSHFGYDILYLRTGGLFWSIDSGGGAGVGLYSGFPDPPSRCYRATPIITRVEDLNIVMCYRGPMYAHTFAGAWRTEAAWGGFSLVYGKTCVALRPDGSVNWDTLPVLIPNWFATLKWSALFGLWVIGFPYWALVTLILLAATARTWVRFFREVARQIRAQRRLARGLCSQCGYDLRATPARCPECGATPTSNTCTRSSNTDAASHPAPISRSSRLAASLARLLLRIAALARVRRVISRLLAHAGRVPRRLVLRGLAAVAILYGAWIGMMAVHELGHVIHAHLSGGTVEQVHLSPDPTDFSRTDLLVNPRPQFVAWGGAIWGSLLPLLAWAILHALSRLTACTHASRTSNTSSGDNLTAPQRWLRAADRLACFFAGFCLIINGAYLAFGWLDKAGDAGTLLRHGATPWSMTAAGLPALAAGIYLWHRLGLAVRPRRAG